MTIHNLDGEPIGFFSGNKKNLTKDSLPSSWRNDNSIIVLGLSSTTYKNKKFKTPKNPFCEACKETDCIISLDGTCEMIRIYQKAKKRGHRLLKPQSLEKK